MIGETTPTTVPAGEELKQAASELGLTLGGGGYTDPSDPDVYWGTTDTHGRVRRSNPIIKRSAALVEPAKWKTEDLAAFQHRMFSAGLYGSMHESEVPFGVFDLTSQRAWQELVDASVAYQAVGKKVTPQDILGGIPSGAGRGATRAPFNAQVSNPIDMRAALKVAATEVLGGAITDEQINAISDRFQQQQIGAQRSAYNTADTGGTSTAAPDFGSFAKEQVRALDPVKADARGAVKVASVIQQMLGGRMPAQSLSGGG